MTFKTIYYISYCFKKKFALHLKKITVIKAVTDRKV